MRMIIASVLSVLIVAGCSTQWTMEDYVMIHESAASEIPVARQMEEILGPADHFITNFGMGDGKKVWNTDCYVNDRYELTMQVEVEVDFANSTLTQTGEPRFWLHYVRESSAGATKFDPSKELEFGIDEWDTVYGSGGNFSAIGVELDTTPAPGMQDYIDRRRSSRIPITLIPE